MHNRILDDILDFRYATPNNLSSWTCSSGHAATNGVMQYIKKLITAGYIEKTAILYNQNEKRRRQLYMITKRGADSIDRKHEYKPVTRTYSDSTVHEILLRFVARGFKELFNARRFEWDVKINDKIKPDLVVDQPQKIFVEMEIFNKMHYQWSKPAESMKKYGEHGNPILVVICCDQLKNDIALNPFQSYKPEHIKIAHEDCKRVSKKIKNPRIFVTHSLFYNRLNEPVCIYKGGTNKHKLI